MTWTKEDAKLGEREPFTPQEQRLEDLKRLCLLHSTNVKKFNDFFDVLNDPQVIECDWVNFVGTFSLTDTDIVEIIPMVYSNTAVVGLWSLKVVLYGTTLTTTISHEQLNAMLNYDWYTKEELQKLFSGWKQS